MKNKQMESYTWRQNNKSIPKFVKLKSKNTLATNKIINMLILFALGPKRSSYKYKKKVPNFRFHIAFIQ